jgi:hypothetical protein
MTTELVIVEYEVVKPGLLCRREYACPSEKYADKMMRKRAIQDEALKALFIGWVAPYRYVQSKVTA